MVSNWEEKTLEDIISKEKYSIKRGPFGSSLRKEFFVENGIRVFEQYNPINNDPNWCRYRITKEKYEELKAFTCKAGDFLISCSGTMGKIVFLPEGTEKGIINQALLKIRLDNDIVDNNFFMYLFQSPYFQNKIFSSSKGSAIQNISSVKDLKKITFLLPTLKEQKIIVEKLDDAFQKIEALENNTKENIKNIEDLYNSYLNKIFTENTDDWEEKIFDKVCNIYTGNSINANIKKQKYSNLDNGYNYIATKDISFSNVINYENGIKIPKDEDKFKIAPKNSILLCIEGGSAGRKIGILKEDVCFVNKLCAFVIKYKYLNYMFVYYYLQSPKFKQIFYDNKTGLIGGVSLNKLKKLTIAFPKIEEQKKIVDKLDIFNNKIQTIKQNYQNKINLLDNLKKSILNKAFKGEV